MKERKDINKMTPDELRDEVRACRKEVDALNQKLKCIALACEPGLSVYEIWQVAPIGSDTDIGQGYYAVDKDQTKTAEAMKKAGFTQDE
jgi:hypothetical protein